MSSKRSATSELNHENWDQEDPTEHEEMGTFKVAPKDIIERRVIRTAKRRNTQFTSDEPRKSLFSGFSGFNKKEPASFDFLANLTNGDKANVNGSNPVSIGEAAVSSTLFGIKPTNASSSGAAGSLFSTPVSYSGSKPNTSEPTTQASSNLFGITSTNTSNAGSLFSTAKTFTSTPTTQASTLFNSPTNTGSIFTAPKADSTVGESIFKVQPTETATGFTPKITNTSTSQVTSTIFNVPSSTPNKSSIFTVDNNSPFKTPAVSSTSQKQSSFGVNKSNNNVQDDKFKTDNEADTQKLSFYSKLKDLNESVLDWIKKNVEETPLCILSPIFKDYEKHLKEIQEEFDGTENSNKADTNLTPSVPNDKSKNNEISDSNKIKENLMSSKQSPFSPSNALNTGSSSIAPSTFVNKNNSGSLGVGSSSAFTFGVKTSTPVSSITTSSSFSFVDKSQTNTTKTSTPSVFGTNTSQVPASTATFSFGTQPNTTSSTFSPNAPQNPAGGAVPFSFGIGKPFSFNTNVQTRTETQENEDKEDEPPKVEYTPVVEENCVYEKKCKIFVKKDDNFADKGVGTLYIKKIEGSGKHQLLVRANTNLGNVLVNLVLVDAIPSKRMGKNNVMMVCIPTPESKPPPVAMLIRVKTSEEADELLETLNKYKT